MKKVIALMLVLVMAFCMMTGCAAAGASSTESEGSGESSEESAAGTAGAAAGVPAELQSVKTMGDLFAMDGVEEFSSGNYEMFYLYAFELNGVYYRAIANLTDEQAETLWNLDFESEDYDQKYNEAVSPLVIDHIDNLSEGEPSEEELDAYVGKTGQDLLNDGWMSSGYNLDGMEFYMNHDVYSFIVVFDGTLDDAEIEEIGEDEAIKDLTIKSVTYNGIGDAFYMGEPEATEEAEVTEETEVIEETEEAE